MMAAMKVMSRKAAMMSSMLAMSVFLLWRFGFWLPLFGLRFIWCSYIILLLFSLAVWMFNLRAGLFYLKCACNPFIRYAKSTFFKIVNDQEIETVLSLQHSFLFPNLKNHASRMHAKIFI